MYYGIDLGTTTTLIAEPDIKGSSYAARQLKIPQQDKAGNSIERDDLPSVAYFPGSEEPVVGMRAKEGVCGAVGKVVCAVKRLMGRDVQPFVFDGKSYDPSDISSLYIAHVLSQAVLLKKGRVSKLTVTVPASFTTKQRKDTQKAIQKACERLKVKYDDNALISEPLAALLSYISYEIATSTIRIDIDKKPLVLVYDIGGGTLDLTLVRLQWKDQRGEKDLKNVDFRVQRVGRYNQVGGEDFDELIAEWLLETMLEQFPEMDIQLDRYERKAVKAQLMAIAEQRKIEFNKEYCSDWDHEPVVNTVEVRQVRYEVESTLTHSDVVRVLEPLIGEADTPKNCVTSIQKFLAKQGVTMAQVDHVLCVGGMSRFMPLKEALEKKYTPAGEKSKFIFNDSLADVAVAKGAAIYSYMKAEHTPPIQEPRADAYYAKTEKGFKKILGCIESENATLFTTVEAGDYLDLYVFAGEDCAAEYAEPRVLTSLMYQGGERIRFPHTFPKGTALEVKMAVENDNKVPRYEIKADGVAIHTNVMEIP
ncbi:Hsp70 family protein [Pelobacter propionicus]|uniref:Heat shock protein 70 n=1 Tax=Pelobacter propionicus (strain DSM 2379 / NBRC 103807 / OttBd1) TaxID=338966 RepID=A1AKC3_PELPD|nr:Hsp70 family protein [Pelobacter propionicus]ABK97793.1 Heat shock protein 70 [Pelobacter propionicus DSM 2379]